MIGSRRIRVLQVGKPEPTGSLPQNVSPGPTTQGKYLLEDSQVLGIGQFGRPEFIGKVAAPDTALRAVGFDDLQS